MLWLSDYCVFIYRNQRLLRNFGGSLRISAIPPQGADGQLAGEKCDQRINLESSVFTHLTCKKQHLAYKNPHVIILPITAWPKLPGRVAMATSTHHVQLTLIKSGFKHHGNSFNLVNEMSHLPLMALVNYSIVGGSLVLSPDLVFLPL